MDPQRARKRLSEERERLERVRAGLVGPDGVVIGVDDTELSSADQHPGDSGSETFEVEKNQALLESVEAELRDIDDALERLDNGSYGKSVLSGETIPDERLEAVPWARYTVEEQARAEHLGRGAPS
jgi:RNA polymerase-binding transcription factor DksA